MLLTIALRAASENGGRAAGDTFGTDPHPAVIDLPGMDHDARRNDSVVEIHEDTALAPLLTRTDDEHGLYLHGKPARDTQGDLRTVLAHLRQKRPDRSDGIILAQLLLSWADAHPKAYWDVTVPAARLVIAERGNHFGVDFAGEHRDRALEQTIRSARDEEMITSAQRAQAPHDPDACGIANCPSCNDVTERTLQRETRTAGTGGGNGSGRSKERPAMPTGSVVDRTVRDIKTRSEREAERWDENEAATAQGEAVGQRRAELEQNRSKLAGGRISDEAHRVLVRRRRKGDPSVGDYVERIGQARLAGVSAREIEEALESVIAGHREKQSDQTAPKDAA